MEEEEDTSSTAKRRVSTIPVPSLESIFNASTVGVFNVTPRTHFNQLVTIQNHTLWQLRGLVTEQEREIQLLEAKIRA